MFTGKASLHTHNPADTWCKNNIIMTSKRRLNIVLTSWWCYFCILCPLGRHNIVKTTGVSNTIECHHNAVPYNMTLHAPLQWLRQNINHKLEPTKYAPYFTLPGELRGAYCGNFRENWRLYNGTHWNLITKSNNNKWCQQEMP